MAKFLNTSATNYFLEELIKNAKDRLILINPFLKLNDRIKELLANKNRLKIDVRIVYGKSELQPEEINWLKELTYIRTSFCKNLHAKCYMNEELCIIASLNLYEVKSRCCCRFGRGMRVLRGMRLRRRRCCAARGVAIRVVSSRNR